VGPKTKKIAIVQARMGSTRLPGKSLSEIAGKPAIYHLFKQLSHSRYLNQVVLATTTNRGDDSLVAYAQQQKWHIYRGSEDDVLDRYYHAAVNQNCSSEDIIVRVTGDDIFVDPEIVDGLLEYFMSRQPAVKHACNNRTATYPYGADVEIFSFDALYLAWQHAELPEEREHVTPYIRNHPELFPFIEIKLPEDLSHIRLSIDYPEDLEFNRRLYKLLIKKHQPPIHLDHIVECIAMNDLKHPLVDYTNGAAK